MQQKHWGCIDSWLKLLHKIHLQAHIYFMGKLRRVALARNLHIASKHNISPNLFEVSLNMFLVGISAFYMDSRWRGERKRWFKCHFPHCISQLVPLGGEQQHPFWLPGGQDIQIWRQLVVWLMNPFCLVGKGFKLKCDLEILTGPPMGLFLQMMPGSSSFPAYPKEEFFTACL